MENAAKELKNLNDQLEGMFKQLGGLDKTVQLTQDLLPKDKFTAEIDGHQFEVSIGISGKAIVFMFNDDIKCGSLFNELKQQKQGILKRIFNIK